MKIKTDEEYSKLIRALPKLKYNSIKEDIKNNGQWDPIKVNTDGIILDAHHRFRICQELNREPKYQVMNFASKTIEKLFVINSNRLRRQLNDFEEAELDYSVEGELRVGGSNGPIGKKGKGLLFPNISIFTCICA